MAAEHLFPLGRGIMILIQHPLSTGSWLLGRNDRLRWVSPAHHLFLAIST